MLRLLVMLSALLLSINSISSTLVEDIHGEYVGFKCRVSITPSNNDHTNIAIEPNRGKKKSYRFKNVELQELLDGQIAKLPLKRGHFPGWYRLLEISFDDQDRLNSVIITMSTRLLITDYYVGWGQSWCDNLHKLSVVVGKE